MRLKFRLSNGKKTFFQWDVNQKIILENPICTQVHFENKDISDKAYVKEVYKDNEGRSVADIPDIFLQYTPGFLFYGYVISEDGKERFTEERGDVSVIRRAKPSDYVFTPEDQKTLEEVFDDAVKYVPEEKTDEEKANARENIEAEFKGNKVDAIGDDADGEHYPSTKAVKDELDKKIDNPQAAAIGEVLTVEEVDDCGIPTKWKTTPVADEQVQADIEELDTTSPAFIKNNPFKPAKTWEETLRKSTYKNSDTYNGMQVYKYYFYNNQLGDRKFILKVNDAITYNIEPTFDALKNALIQNGIVWLETKYANIIFAASESDDIHLYQSYYQLDHQTLPPANMEGSYPATPGGFVCNDIDTEHENINNYEQCKFYHRDGRLSYPCLYAPKTVKTYDKFDDIKGGSSKGDMFWYLSTGAVSDSMGLTDADMPVMCYCTYAEWGSAAKNTKFYIETATGRKFRTYNNQYNHSSKWTMCEEITPSGDSSAFYINVTSTTDSSGNTTYSADKTADEIITAYESGAVMIGVYGELYMQGVVHIANPDELTLIFAAQELNPIDGEITQRQCSVNINKDNKEMQVLYGVATKILDKGIVFMVNNNTVQTSPNSGNFDEILQAINSSIPLSKSINAILVKGSAGYNLSRLEGNSNGILIKFDDVINSKTYIVFADAKNKTFTYSEEDLPSGGSVGEIDPKKIPDMYYTEVGSVDIADKIITSITLYRSEEGTLEKVCPFELGQVWKVITSNYTSDELEVKQSSDGTLYIGDLNKSDLPFYITTTSSSANPNWLSMLGISGNAVASLVGVSGTMSGGEIIHKIPEQYIPNVVALKNELPDMAIKVIELDNVIASPTINIDDVDKPVLAIIKCDDNTQFKFDRVLIKTPLRERYTGIVYQSGANSENPYACMLILIKKIASSEDMFEAICLNARTKSNTILDIDNSGFENKDYYSLPDGIYNFLSTYTSDSHRIKGFTTVTNHNFKCYDTGVSIMFSSNGSIAGYGRAYSITETDPTVPKWAKAATKPTYTAEEVGALPNTTVIPPAYSLPQATADALGGIKADAATAEDTQDVRMGADGKLRTKPSGGSTVTVDSELSSTSVNPVQNKIITAALAEKITAPTTAAVGQIIKIKSVDDAGKPTEWEAADIPSGSGETWTLIKDITLEEDVASIHEQNLNLKKLYLTMAIVGTSQNTASVNGELRINNETYFYSNVICVAEGIKRWLTSYVELIGDVKRHISAANNNNTYQSTITNIGYFGDGTVINDLKIIPFAGGEKYIGAGTRVKIYGISA